MYAIELAEPIRDRLIRDPLGPILSFPCICDDPPDDIRDAVDQQLAVVPSEIVAEVREDQSFRFENVERDEREVDREARIWAVAKTLARELPRHRLRAVLEGSEELQCLDALSDLEFDEEGLLPMAEFEGFRGELRRRGFSFTIMPTTEATNSSYWVTLALRKTGVWKSARIRLDPYMFGPSESFRQMTYKMWSWGERLSWADLSRRSKDAYGEWLPSPLSTKTQNTQFVWVDQEMESDLQLEELPLREQLQGRGTRYCHAIFDKQKSRVVHIDGAVRILSGEEWDSRIATHLKDAGKVGKRVKIFRVDEPIETATMSTVCMNYFIWNHDVARFFGAIIPDGV